jgi:Tfp pilus assembly protein PilZ
MANGIEKRLFPRKPVRIKVTFEDVVRRRHHMALFRQLSLGGIFIASDIPISVGIGVFMSFSLPNDPRHLRASGEIIRVEKEPGARGWG